MSDPPAIDIDNPASFVELATSLGLPAELLAALEPLGYKTIAEFGYSIPTLDALPALLQAIPEDTWSALDAPVPAISPATGRLRRLLERCHACILDSKPPPPTSAAPPAGAPPPAALNSWAEHAPPRLSNAAVASMPETFAANYPGEILDQDSMPSLRLLSIVYQWFRPPDGQIKWVPWQLRLSQRQYQEILEARTHRMLRTEAQLVSAALLDETPEIPISSMHLTPAWLARTQAVFRNAIALCGGAHLATLKTFDKKVFDYVTQSMPATTGLRAVNLHELLHADRKLWNEIASLHAQNWTLDDALHELSNIRSDMHALLQPRARPAPAANTGKGDPARGGKGRGKGKQDGGKQPRKETKQTARETRTLPSTPAAPLATKLGNKTLCLRYNKGTCTDPNCKYTHACGFKLPNGNACGKKHPAYTHVEEVPPPAPPAPAA